MDGGTAGSEACFAPGVRAGTRPAEARCRPSPGYAREGGRATEIGSKEFSTGSFGWNLTGKTMIEVTGIRLNVQIGMNLTVVGSKDVPKNP